MNWNEHLSSSNSSQMWSFVCASVFVFVQSIEPIRSTTLMIYKSESFCWLCNMLLSYSVSMRFACHIRFLFASWTHSHLSIYSKESWRIYALTCAALNWVDSNEWKFYTVFEMVCRVYIRSYYSHNEIQLWMIWVVGSSNTKNHFELVGIFSFLCVLVLCVTSQSLRSTFHTMQRVKLFWASVCVFMCSVCCVHEAHFQLPEHRFLDK